MEPTAPLEAAEPAIIRYAASDEDVVAIHRFLVIVAQPELLAPVDAQKSVAEIWRVCNDEAAIMLIHKDRLIGTMGVIAVDWWYSRGRFMTERWHHVLPAYKNTPQAKMLEDEARAIAAAANLPFILNGPVRSGSSGRRMTMPRLYLPESAKAAKGD